MIVGIDLGTTNSAISYIDENGIPQIIPNRDGNRTTPSVILFDGDLPIIGEAAKRDSVSDPLNTVQFIKRQMGSKGFEFITDNGDEFTPEELSAMILKRLKEDAEEYLGQTVTDAVITVPAYFNDAQRKSTRDAGTIAGLNVLKIINEPTAAALAYGVMKNPENQVIMVYDLGGGTFDVTLMEIKDGDITIRGTEGDKNLGGFDFDNKIMQYVMDKFEEEHGICIDDYEEANQELREKAEQCKKTLSNRSKSNINISCEGKSLKVEVTLEEFNNMIKPLIDRTIMIMENVLDDADMGWSDVDKVLLVGGSTRVKLISDEIERLTGKKVSREVNPDEVVSMGAAIQASMVDVNNIRPETSGIKVIDVNSHSLGIAVHDNGRMVNSIIIPKNTQIPCSYEKTFSTMHENQEYVMLQVTEGDDEELEYVTIIGEATIKLAPRPVGSPLKVIISYDENSIINVKMIDGVDNAYLGEMYIERKANLTDEEINNKKEKLSDIDVD